MLSSAFLQKYRVWLHFAHSAVKAHAPGRKTTVRARRHGLREATARYSFLA
ncbi:Hypothetical protein ETEE_1874 [Edwardsiella anguillarum ET080813]|uniref:Uncharacterized protein n=1 Tax=Edwardsiella anguillarum ET080813 TaxID=667120 RepID=A0A076LK43_9GAMM|nr:Hypothetical protein ETEE_1874 [Edwardsiella anguillarum ET080813]